MVAQHVLCERHYLYPQKGKRVRMSYTVRTLAEEFLAVCAMVNAGKTVDNYRRYLAQFAAHVGDKPIEELRPVDLLTWGTTWHQVQAVQRLFSWAVNDAEIASRNPFKRVKKPRAGRRKRTLTKRQLLEMMRSTDREFRNFLLMMRETICRPQEARELQWEWIKSENPDHTPIDALRSGEAFFAVEEYKSRERRADPDAVRVIPISARLARFLLRLADESSEPHGIILENSKRQPWTANAVRLRMKRMRNRLGLKKDGRGENVVCYTIRHTQATNAAAAGVRDKVLAEVMGHTSTRTTNRYQHLSANHLKEAMNKMRNSK